MEYILNDGTVALMGKAIRSLGCIELGILCFISYSGKSTVPDIIERFCSCENKITKVSIKKAIRRLSAEGYIIKGQRVMPLRNQGEIKKFEKPTQAMVFDYLSKTFTNRNQKELLEESKRFVEFYESKNWMVGRNPMTNWKPAANSFGRRASIVETSNLPQV